MENKESIHTKLYTSNENTNDIEHDTSNSNLLESDDHDIPELRFSGHARNASFTQTFINLLKAHFGVGILNFPQAIYKSGAIFGPLISILAIVVVAHCIYLLLECARAMRKRYNKEVIGYAGTAKYAFIPYLTTKSRYIVYIVNFFIIVGQFGGCIAYTDFTANTLYSITDNKFGDIRIWIGIVLGIVLIPSLLSSLEIVSILSGSANLLTLFGLGATMIFVFMNIPAKPNTHYIGSIDQLPLYFSTFLFVSKSSTAILPIENECEDPKSFDLALKIVLSIFYSVLVVFGTCGYLAFGNQIRDSITLNLPVNCFFNSVKIIYALAILLTFFIAFYILMSVTVPTVIKITENPKKKVYAEYLFRLCVIIVIGICALAIPKIENIISLIGAFACSMLSIIFPPLIHLATFWKEYDGQPPLSRIQVAKDVAIIAIGCVLGIAGVYSTMLKLIQNS